MTRPTRSFLPGQPVHLIQGGNNRQPIFFGPEDYERYCGWLCEASAANQCTVYAYVLMTNHVHLLIEPATRQGIPRALQSLGRRYVRYVNLRYDRTGTLLEGRYRAAPIDVEAYFLACCRYIDLNPVRAGIADHPRAYAWSSYAAHAHGAADRVVGDHPLLHALGTTDADRRAAYRALFRQVLEPDLLDTIRRSTNSGWALGDRRFQQRIAEALGHPVGPRPRGRPRKAPQPDQAKT